MKKYLCGMMALAAMAGGCASKNSTANNGALKPGAIDLTPVAQPAPTAYAPPLQAVAAAPVVEQPATPAAFTGGAVGGSSYTVQKGDTLYKIARDRYGDGKQWERIASANPGLSPATLKVGQKIAIP